MDIRIKDMNKDEMPREKMMSKGVKYLSNSELLAILIRTGNKKYNALELSSMIIKKSENGIRSLHEMSIDELCNIDGVGPSKATIIKAALELGNRVSNYIPEKYKIKNPWDIYIYYMEEMRYMKKEVFKIVLLNTKNEIISDVDVSVGSLNSSIVHPREVFVEAIRKSANSMILIHNHPSGNPSPSDEDIRITERLMYSGEIIGIEVLDHIIIGDGEYYSMKEEGDI
ncbi:DNA replication and repair protein RadC [Peptostreptococcus russellii]|uniref:DNA replication and repair protein RadC n=2 Tax=Peptostreptococcus russellii TaxID=215200 RepID=A0A1H8FP45_9FIRM|nr:DNA repair protein RadC [Peptostreptococcus russellii]SEN33482.1 DNA replication and repair protein RadC [Peptostreptococcus russellii]